MNVDTSTATTRNTASTVNSDLHSSAPAATKENSKTFKDELNDVKAQDKTEKTEDDSSNVVKNDSNIPNQNVVNQLISEKANVLEGAVTKDSTEAGITKSLTELNTEISTLNGFKTGTVSNSNKLSTKHDEKIGGESAKSIQMDNQDIAFFLNLSTEQMGAQAAHLAVKENAGGIELVDIKSEATQKTVQVSKSLMDAISESANTNKPFRIDFDKDVSVIMKVSKDGVLSATFLPGNSAVEAYLKNNIASLRQNFDNQNLAYEQLSYTERKKDNQQQKQQQNRGKQHE